jgi:ABC-2 type transport system ATP-binding protein
MRKLGKRQLTLHLQNRLEQLPAALADSGLELAADGSMLVYTFDAQGDTSVIGRLLRRLGEQGIDFKDLNTSESSLEDIFVGLLHRKP